MYYLYYVANTDYTGFHFTMKYIQVHKLAAAITSANLYVRMRKQNPVRQHQYERNTFNFKLVYKLIIQYKIYKIKWSHRPQHTIKRSHFISLKKIKMLTYYANSNGTCTYVYVRTLQNVSILVCLTGL